MFAKVLLCFIVFIHINVNPKQHTEATRMASTTTAPATAPWTASKNSTLSTPLPRKLPHKVCLLWDVRTPICPFPCHVAYCVQPFQNAVRPNVLLQTWKVAKLYSAAVFWNFQPDPHFLYPTSTSEPLKCHVKIWTTSIRLVPWSTAIQ